MKIKLLNSLEKVFSNTEPRSPELSEYTILKNEPFSFQLACFPETSDMQTKFCCRIHSKLESDIEVFSVKDAPSGLSVPENADDFYYENRDAYPDILEPASGVYTLPSEKWSSLWFKYTPTGNAFGKETITVEIFFGDRIFGKKSITLNIIDCALPKQELLYTNWLHSDCLCTHYNISPFTPDYWAILEKYVKNAAKHGMNMILTPIFTPPIDTKIGGERPTIQLVDVTKNNTDYTFGYKNFEKFVSLCLSSGIEAFEISHLFTQWGANAAPKIVGKEGDTEVKLFGWDTNPYGDEYRRFLTLFAESFNKEIEKLGIETRIFMHVSDEPSFDDFENYSAASAFLHSLFPKYRFIDALSDLEFYEAGLVDTPIPNEHHADEFFPHTDKFWTYCCCAQSNDFLPNRFFAMPSLRNRILGFLLYKYNAEGFLQWGHNFWYTQYSVSKIDPFYTTDAGGAFPSGDSFVVYPGKNKEPVNSLRHEVFYEGICDLGALKLLEKLSSREHALKILEKGLNEPLTFRSYPHDNEWLLCTRTRINAEIEKILGK